VNFTYLLSFRSSARKRQLLATSMEMRQDQFAYMITAAWCRLTSKFTFFFVPLDEYELKAVQEQSKVNNQGNWHTACHTYTGRFLRHELELTTYREFWIPGDFVLQYQTPGGLLSGRLCQGGLMAEDLCLFPFTNTQFVASNAYNSQIYRREDLWFLNGCAVPDRQIYMMPFSAIIMRDET